MVSNHPLRGQWLRVIDNIVESLVSGDLDVGDFMRAVEEGIEAHEASVHGITVPQASTTLRPSCLG